MVKALLTSLLALFLLSACGEENSADRELQSLDQHLEVSAEDYEWFGY